jgi:hypothetical protein
MKTKIFAAMIISMIINCKKESNSTPLNYKADILGTWVNTLNNKDTIIVNDTLINRWDFEDACLCHRYNYTIKNDSIILKYLGPIKVLILGLKNPGTFYINIYKDTLEIKNFNETYPGYIGDYFIKVLNK